MGGDGPLSDPFDILWSFRAACSTSRIPAGAAPLRGAHERRFDLRIVAADEDGAPEMVPPARRASRPAADERLSLCVSGQRDLTLAFC